MVVTTMEFVMEVNVIVMKVGLVHLVIFRYVRINVDIKGIAQTLENVCVCQDSKEVTVKRDM
jgi:hypothetical protein